MDAKHLPEEEQGKPTWHERNEGGGVNGDVKKVISLEGPAAGGHGPDSNASAAGAEEEDGQPDW